MKFNSIASRITAVAVFVVLFAVFFLISLHFMDNRRSVILKIKPIDISKPQ